MTEQSIQSVSKESSCIVGVRFTTGGKTYHFDASQKPDLQIKDKVVVETSRGWQLGEVIQIFYEEDTAVKNKRKPIVRRATPRDLLIRQGWKQKEDEVIIACQERMTELGLRRIKVIMAEYSFDGTRLAIVVCSENEEKIETKALRLEMQKKYSPTQVEIRQVGPRDAAKMICGLGACGQELRCCSKFLSDFCSISIRMAKEQEISLTPTEITGMCGRLRCCLNYEYDQYLEYKKNLPKKNKHVNTPLGEGKVIEVLTIKESVRVELAENGIREFTKDEIKNIETLENNKKRE